jgi:hypothetical protein
MKTKRNITRTETFELMVDGAPMLVKATSFQTYTLETQYRVSVNGSPVYIFAWHPVLRRITAIQRGSGTGLIPHRIEEAIGQHLSTRMAA